MSYIGTEPKDIRSFGRTQFDYTASQGQTAFTGADDDGKVLAFTTGQINVYVNGILMDDSDFTTTGTGTVTLASAANLNDIISIVSFESNIPDNDYVPASGGTFTGNIGFGTAPTRQVHIAGNPSIMLMEDTGGGTNDKKAQVQVDSGVFEINSRNDDNSSLVDNILTAELDTGDVGIGTVNPAFLEGSGLMIQRDSTATLRLLDNGAHGVEIRAHADAAKFASANAKPFIFYTSTSTTPRVRIDSDGLKFGSDSAAANALDDYEEGTWSPSLNNGAFSGVLTARYIKIGKQVTVFIYAQGITDTTTTSALQISGLPFTSVGTGTLDSVSGPVMIRYLDVGVTEEMGVCSFVGGNTAVMRFYVLVTGGTYQAVHNSQFNNGSIGLRATVTYEVA